MKIKAAILAVSAAALLAACSPASADKAPAADAASTAPVELKAPAGV